MTTIAWDGKTLAGDRRAGGTFLTRVKKIWRLSDGRLFGCAGSLDEMTAVRDWLEGEPKPKGLRDFTGILIELDGTVCRFEEKLTRTPILERCHAVGSGAPFAITAMALGKTAREAVGIAARFDPRTGGGVDVLER